MAEKSPPEISHEESAEFLEEKPMIIAGIAASQAIDSSAEVLDVEGCDITSLQEGRGFLNWEHLQKDNDKSVPGSEIVGKIVFAKKILSEDDCADPLQEHFWEQSKVPFVYIVGRLYNNQPGHTSSKHIAGIIRDAIQHHEDLVIGFSIEGSTLKREGNKLTQCVAKNCAVTLQPCNKTAKFVVVSDPYLKIDGDVVKKTETVPPLFSKLGHHSMVYGQDLLKMLAAGSTDAAPSMRVQGPALAIEGLARKESKRKLRKKLLSALQKWDGSTSVRDLLRAELPEVSDDFLDHFDRVVEDQQIKLKKSVPVDLIGLKNKLYDVQIQLKEKLNKSLDPKHFDSRVLVATSGDNYVGTVFDAGGTLIPLHGTIQDDCELVPVQDLQKSESKRKLVELLHEIGNPHQPRIALAEHYTYSKDGLDEDFVVSPTGAFLNGHKLSEEEVTRIKQHVKNKVAKLTAHHPDERIEKVKAELEPKTPAVL